MANIAWAVANLGMHNEPLLAAISSSALPTIKDY
jgi:hypothetical protein